MHAYSFSLAMKPTRSRNTALPALMEEIVEEILLRLPPEEPAAHLFCAAMVRKAWFHILSDGGFRRRYCRFHQTPILLGYICNAPFIGAGGQFVPTASFSPPPLPTSRYYRLLDCRHGRVLFDNLAARFIIWDLITGNGQHLSFPSHGGMSCSFDGAVLCARHLHGCDHFNCHGGPFLVVFVGTHVGTGNAKRTWASVCVLVRDRSMERPNSLQ
jgi:hypothetical protein